jgi:tetratricopeptide (TPR) repeat protein
VSRPIGDEVETCGICHARRSQFSEGWRPGQPMADHYRPIFLTPDLFEDDGQMKDEVFNYSSFLQSKMHAKGVVCSDCHEPHGGKLKASRAEVCSICHSPQKFAAPAHTGHAAGSGKPDCVSCHMPVRTYMVVDPRHDHSFRVPRPDLSVSHGTPNACSDCHKDKPASWAAAAVERWHGPDRKGFQNYAPAFHAARTDQPHARSLLLQVANDPASPAIARATSLQFLHRRPSTAVTAAMIEGLSDSDPMVRLAALGGLDGLTPGARWRHAAPLLSDSVRVVRIQAANLLAEGAPAGATPAQRAALEAATSELIASERFNADRAEGRSNLARFLVRQGKPADAEREYLVALDLGLSISPRVDLADLYRSLGREAEAEALLRQTISLAPAAAAPRHALGLSLVRARRYDEALIALGRAAELEPSQPRYAYVYAVALDSAGKADEARVVLERGLVANPSDVSILSMLLQRALRDRDARRALPYAERLRILLPDDRSVAEIMRQLQTAIERAR